MKDLPVSILSSTELNTFVNRLVGISNEALADNPYVVTLGTLIAKSNADLSVSLGKTLGSEYTSKLLIQDQDRDHAFIGFRDFVSSFTHDKNVEKKGAAIILASIIENVGNTIYMLGYAVESSKMNSLITNLRTPQAQQAIETIGAGDWFEQLTTSQETFEKLHQTKVEADSEINYLTIKDSRTIISRYLQALLIYIGTNSDLDGAKYEPVKEKINVLITDAVAIARGRITHVENVNKEKDMAAV